MSEAYEPENLLDRRTSEATMELHYAHMHERERELVGPHLPAAGAALSIGCGWDPGRHLFPARGWELTGVELDPAGPAALVEQGVLDHGLGGRAGELNGELEAGSFDAVLYRLVLHHIAYQGPLGPVFEEARRLLRPGGLLVAVEPGSWHPVGAGLGLANSVGLGTAVHGTPDDIPLSPRELVAVAARAGLEPDLRAVTYSWRRMPQGLQRALWPVDAALGSRRRAAMLGHTLLLLARRPL